MARPSLLNRLFGSQPSPFPPAAPDKAFHVIGDLHGCLAQLVALTDKLEPDTPIVCVGDYVDRGDDSAGVMRWLAARPDITCLMGNHEAMMRDFIDAPEKKGARWLRYGGLQTLASFDIPGASETAEPDALVALRDALVTAMGDELLAWLRGLPTSYRNGNVAVVHAGADPELPITMQSDKTLMWGHGDFDKKGRGDGVWVVYGHTIVPEPLISNGRIGIDTGAYATGQLTAVTLQPDGHINFTTA